MGRSHYPGGHTKVAVGPDGTQWEAPWNIKQAIDDHYCRWDKRDNLIATPQIAIDKRRRKEFSYFMLACARAFTDETLSPVFPPPPQWLRKEIRRAGGNIKWLHADQERVILFTRILKADHR